MSVALNRYYNNETKTLTIPFDFCKKLDDLPPDVEKIIFKEDKDKYQYSEFNQLVNSLPNTLTHLTFGWGFKRSVNQLPTNLTHLTFGVMFNKSVDKLPTNLTHLTFGVYFNKSVNNLPENLTHLIFGSMFNLPVEFLPKNLTHINFGCSFIQIVNLLPKTIKEIGFGAHSEIKNNIPENIEYINIKFFDEQSGYNAIENLPLYVKEIRIKDVSKLHYLKKISFGHHS
jgi:hypothetical protein